MWDVWRCGWMSHTLNRCDRVGGYIYLSIYLSIYIYIYIYIYYWNRKLKRFSVSEQTSSIIEAGAWVSLIVAWLEQEHTEESASRFLFAAESLVSELRSDFFTNRPERTWIRKLKDLCLRQSSETWLEHVVEVRSYFFLQDRTHITHCSSGVPSVLGCLFVFTVRLSAFLTIRAWRVTRWHDSNILWIFLISEFMIFRE